MCQCKSVTSSSPNLDVFVVGQAGGHDGQGVVVEMELPQVGDVHQGAVLHQADLIMAQTQPVGNK